MDWLTIVLAVLGSTVVAALVSGAVSWRSHSTALAQQRMTENTRLMAELIAVAHARDPHGSRAIGRSEMIGAAEMLAAIGREYAPLKETARSFLGAQRDSFAPGRSSEEPILFAAFDSALKRL